MDRREFTKLSMLALGAAALPGCGDSKSHAQAVYMLVDTSGTYALEIDKAQANGVLSGIPTAGQMLLGFILPFALAFVAVPLESFIASARTVLGSALVALTQGAALGLRLLATLVKSLARLVITFYDIVIVLPLLEERLVKREPKPATYGVDEETLAVRRL